MMICSLARSKSRGIALMAVLWLIAILAIACMATLRVISFDMELASAKVHGSSARYLAEMGIAVGSHDSVKRDDPLLHRLDEETGEGYDVKKSSEGGRFNLNTLATPDEKSLLKSIFIDWGLELEDAQEVADALVDWVDAGDEEQLNGAEKKYYESQGLLNQPFNRPFASLSEASLVKGMDLVEEVKPEWRDWFTIWSAGKLDLNEAEAELIAAAAEIPVDQAEIIPEKVRGMDQLLGTEDDVLFEDPATPLKMLGIDPEADQKIANRFTVNDPVTRIESIGHAVGAKRKITVIVGNTAGKPALFERTEEIIP